MSINKLKRVVIKEELVALCEDFKGALVLNQFIYWSERVKDTDKFLEEEKERALRHNKKIDIETSNGWIYKTADELSEELMIGVSASTIRRYIKKLVDKGYLSERTNPLYKWDKTIQYRVNLLNIQNDLNKLGYALEGYTLLIDLDIESKKVASIGSTNNLDESSENDSNNSNVSSIISQNKKNIQDEIKQDTHENIKLLKSSGIKYVPYKKELENILNMDTDRLKKAIEITIEKAEKPNWNYLYSTYDYKRFSDVKSKKTSFHNFTETFTKYDPDELNEIIDKSQVEKFEKKEINIEVSCSDKIFYEKAVKNNWVGVKASIDKAIRYAKANNLDYPKIFL